MITTIIFDMNGVITNDEHCHELATKLTFGPLGLDITPEIYRKYCLGRTDMAAFKDLIEDFNVTGVDLADIIRDKTKRYLDLVANNLKIYPGVVDCIERLSKDFRLALTTSSTRAEAYSTLILTDLTDKFNVVITSENVSKGKPDPEPYLLTLKKLSAEPDDCVVIEDSENGIRSAKAAGIRCLAIPNTEPPEKLVLADAVFHNYDELTEAFFTSFYQ